MLAVEDARDGLKWAESIGGLKALIQRSEKNLKTVADWAASSGWADFLAERPETRSCTSICLKIVDPWFRSLDAEAQAAAAKLIAALLAPEGVAYDIGSYPHAPVGRRPWGGATVAPSDRACLPPRLSRALGALKSAAAAARDSTH